MGSIASIESHEGRKRHEDNHGRDVRDEGFKDQNRKAYSEGRNGDIWREVYAQLDRMTIKTTIQKTKSRMAVAEVMSLMLINPMQRNG